MPDRELEYRIKNVSRAVLSQPWLCHYAKLEEIRAFLEFRAAGNRLDEDKVRQAFAPNGGNSLFYDDDGTRIDVDGIRYIPIMGVMAPRMNLMMRLSGGVSTQKVINDVRAAIVDENVETVLLHIDSPGGIATLIPELADVIYAGRAQKRIVSIGEGMMASAALWVGTAATEVFASTSTDVGSQGAYQIVMTDVEFAKQVGETYHVIRAGEFKAIGIRHEELTETGREEIQRRITELDDMFVSALARNRSVSEDFVRDRFGRGKVFSAQDAAQRNLIDGVVAFDDLIDRERRRNAGATTVSVNGERFMKVTPRVKAALFAQGHIDSIDASDEVCIAYLRGLASVTGKSYEDAGEDELIALIPSQANTSAETSTDTTTGIDHQGQEYTAQVLESGPTVDELRAEQRARNAEIRLAGQELRIPDSMITEAICGEASVEEVREHFKKHASLGSQAVGVTITGAGSAEDKVTSAATGALLSRMGYSQMATDEERQLADTFYNATMLDMARECVRISGGQVTGDREADARAFLALGSGMGKQNATQIRYASEPSYNRAGDHPDALSNLMGRILDDAYDQAPATYTAYTKRVPDVPDDRPKTFIEAAVFQELDAMGEDETHKQLGFQSQLKAMIEVAKYGNKVALTEHMIIRDDLGVFDQQLRSLQLAAVNTVDNSCRTLLVSNPTLIDGTAMFTTAKGNLIDTGSGGAPSEAQASEHRRLHRRIKGYGSSRTINRTPDKGLFPAALEQATMRTFRTAFGAGTLDDKSADSDTNRNTVGGMLTMAVLDGMLDDYTNGDKEWWTMVSGLEPIIIAFLLGKGGPTGSRMTWTDPDTGSRYIAVDMWAGYAPLNWRGTVLNKGQ